MPQVIPVTLYFLFLSDAILTKISQEEETMNLQIPWIPAYKTQTKNLHLKAPRLGIILPTFFLPNHNCIYWKLT